MSEKETYCGGDDYYNSYYHAAELWKFEPETEEERSARKRMRDMLGKKK